MDRGRRFLMGDDADDVDDVDEEEEEGGGEEPKAI